MKTLSGMDARVIGLKLAGLSVSPFLYIKIVQAFFHLDGTIPPTSNPGPFNIEAAREKALVKSGHVTPQILDIA